MRFQILFSVVVLSFVAFQVAGQSANLFRENAAVIDSLNNECKNLWFSNTNRSIEIGTFALLEAQKMNYGEGIATAYNNLGVAFWVRGEFDRSLKNYYNSINVRDTVGGNIGLGNTYHNIANIFKDRKNYKEAKVWFKKALELRYEINDSLGVSFSVNNLGLISAEEKKYDSALYFISNALDIRELLGDTRGIATSKMSLGKTYLELGNLYKAEELYKESLNGWEEINHLQGQADVLLELAKLSILKGDKSATNNYLKKGIENAENIGAKPQLFNLYKFSSDFYKEVGDTAKAFLSLEIAYTYRDSIYSEQKEGIIAEYNHDQVVHSKELLEKENLLQKELLLRQKDTTKATVVLLMLSFITIFLVFRVLRIRSKANTKLAVKNKLIEEQKEEINNINLDLEKKIAIRTQRLKESNDRLIRYSLFNSHKVRGPLARILGLANLTKISQDDELRAYIDMIDQSALELDDQIRKVTKELTEHIDKYSE